MEYTINLSINGQCLTADKILSVNGTVDIIRCNFTFEGWDDFPARVAIFQSKAQRKAWVASLMNGSCLIPWEALVREGEVLVALVGTNTDGQVQRTETKTVVLQKKTLQGGVNSITPTPDQYAQFIAQVEEIIGQAGVLSVNGMTGDVTLTYSDVNALPDSTVIPTKTSDLQNDSGFITSIPSEYVTETELQTAISGKADSSSLSTVATTGNYDDLIDKPTIPSRTSQLQNDSGFITSVPVSSVNGKTGAVNLNASDVWALPNTTTIPTKTSDLQNDSNFVSDSSYVHTDNNFTNAEKTKLAGIEAGAEVNDVTSVNGQTGSVSLDADDISCDDSQFLLIQASDVQDAIENLDYEANYILSIKQDTLVSGTNIKTINSQSILGSGDLSLATLPTVASSDNGKVLKVVNGEWAKSSESGLTSDIKDALLAIFEKVAFIDNTGQSLYDDLFEALYPVSSISAVYTQSGTVYDTDSLDDLKSDLVVTATYEDSSTAVVTDYTLSGTLAVGTSTITVSYGGKTTTFTVTVTAGGDPNLLYSIENATINNDYIDTAINLYTVNKDFTIAFDADITTISSGPRFIDGLELITPYQGINISLPNNNLTQFNTRLFNQYKITSIASVAGSRLRFVCTHTAGSNKMTTKYRVGTGSVNINEVTGATWNASNTGTIHIGSPASNTNFDWSGTVNSCYIYDRVFSGAEINDYLGV